MSLSVDTSTAPGSGNAGFVVDLDGFEGPIDLLLSLAREQKVDLAKISILALAEQYAVSRGTARSALAILVEEGLVEVLPGQGRRVVGGPRSTPPDTEWGRVAAALRERLEAGEYADAPMPSEAALVAEFGVSRNTVRRAYKHLVDVGAVVIRHGAGAFPAPR